MKILLSVLAAAALAAAPRGWSTGESAALDGPRRLSAGQFHTCYAAPDGRAKCWGQNTSGALGDGTTTDRNTPVTVVDANNVLLADVIEVSAGGEFTCALRADGRVFCWGRNDRGQLGDGTTTPRTRAAQATGFSDVVHVAAGSSWVCVLRQFGEVFCWGANQAGQLGIGVTGPDLLQPQAVLNLPAPSIWPRAVITPAPSFSMAPAVAGVVIKTASSGTTPVAGRRRPSPWPSRI